MTGWRAQAAALSRSRCCRLRSPLRPRSGSPARSAVRRCGLAVFGLAVPSRAWRCLTSTLPKGGVSPPRLRAGQPGTDQTGLVPFCHTAAGHHASGTRGQVLSPRPARRAATIGAFGRAAAGRLLRRPRARHRRRDRGAPHHRDPLMRPPASAVPTSCAGRRPDARVRFPCNRAVLGSAVDDVVAPPRRRGG